MSRARSVDRDPELSVVIVCHGAWALTERALAALAENTDYRFELIFVDNASRDETRARLVERGGAQVILNDHNRGFGPAVNQGAAHARGRYLLLLNTDAFVQPGWLEPMLDAITLDGIGAVVPRLLHPDGSLQDAGTLLARDGTVLVYGDSDDPNRPCYRFRRTLDLGSAACMLIRRDVFEALGGFDELFVPAYYEDADLCMRLAQHGLRVVYEPRSTVTHFRYGSGGDEIAIALSDRNRHLFAQRWAAQLNGRPSTFVGASEQAVVFARDAPATPRFLICATGSDAASRRLADVLLDTWPCARLTLANGGRPADDSGQHNPWLELVDDEDPGWLADRLFHYDLVLLDGEPDRRLLDSLASTQPQAGRARVSDLHGAATQRLLEQLAGAGIARP